MRRAQAGPVHAARRPSPVGLLLTAALHAALLAAFLSRQGTLPHLPGSVPATGERPAITWILPQLAAEPRPAPPQAGQPPQRHAAPRPASAAAAQPITLPQRAGQAAAPAASAADAAAPAATAAPTAAATAAPAAEPGAEPQIGDLATYSRLPPVSAAELLRLTLHGAGAIDKELRNGKLAPLPPAHETIRGKIDAAFEAAHQAVKPKWYEAARVSEISRPGSGSRVYKIRTALGTFCVTVGPADIATGLTSPTYSNCP